MAEQGFKLDEEKFFCSICLDLLNEPVTTSCGHSFCKSCIRNHWDAEDQKGTYTCPQCRQAFMSRPVLGKNTMLADLVEELKKNVLQAAPHPQHYAEPGDVACDVCTERKLKASKSCLQCMASYCELHLQPHYESPNFQRHKLVEALAKLQENMCCVHSKVKELFCHSDQQCICSVCAMEEHSGHDTVSAIAERTERQRELGPRWQKIQQRIQDREKHMKLLQQQMEAIASSADKAMRDTQTMFNQLHQLVEKRSSDVLQQIRFQQQTELSRAKELQKKLQQEVTDLRRRDAELEQLSRTEDHGQFLLSYPLLLGLSESTHFASINIHPQSYFQEVTAAVSELVNKLQCILSQDWSEVSLTEGETLLRTEQHKTLVKQQMHLVPPPPPCLQPPTESRTSVKQQPWLVPPPPPPLIPSLQPPTESRTLVNQQQRLVPPPPPSLQPPTESKTLVKQQPCLVPPPLPYIQTLDELKTLMKKQLHLAPPPSPPPPSLQPSVESKTFANQQPCLVLPGESKTLVKQQPHLVLPPPSLRLPAESKSLVRQQPCLVLPPPLLQSPVEPKTRDEFLQYSQHITLDPNTVNKGLELSEGNRKVTWINKIQSYPDHADRFIDSFQVLSRESLTGRCYWEVKRTRSVSVAVAYRSISRTGSGSVFGDNDKSWATYCCLSKYEFKHNSIVTFLSGLRSSTVGVYLDHSAGILSFYSVSETMTLLHRVQTTFTQPLHAGLWVGFGSSAELVSTSVV